MRWSRIFLAEWFWQTQPMAWTVSSAPACRNCNWNMQWAFSLRRASGNRAIRRCRPSRGKRWGGRRSFCGAMKITNQSAPDNWPSLCRRRHGKSCLARGQQETLFAVRGDPCPPRASRLRAERAASGGMALDRVAQSGRRNPQNTGCRTYRRQPRSATIWFVSPSIVGSWNATTRNSNRNSASATSKAAAGEASSSPPRCVSPLTGSSWPSEAFFFLGACRQTRTTRTQSSPQFEPRGTSCALRTA